jgi:hypothetical protein
MADYFDCTACGELMARAGHRCPPAWLVRNARDDEAESYTIYALTDVGAAAEFCRRMDEGERPRDRQVVVQRKEPYVGLKLGATPFDMRAELVPQYSPY